MACRNKRLRAAERRIKRHLEITQVKSRRLLRNTIAHYEIQNHANLTPTDFLNLTRSIVTDFFRRNPGNKFQLSLSLILVKVDAARGVIEEEETFMSTKQEVVYEATNVVETYDRMVTKIIELFANFLRKGSGWRLKRVVKLIITKSRQNPNSGSSHIPLPKKIANKKALINMENKDDMCFKYAVTRALNPVSRDAERITKVLKKHSDLNWDGIEFPTPCTERQFKTFEKNNDVSINVFGHEGDEIFPLYVSEAKHEKVVWLFFQRSKDDTNSHYCVVKSMSRLTSSQGRKHNGKIWVCNHCINHFITEDALNKHKLSCSQHDCVHTTFPKPGENVLKFKNSQNAIECPIKIFADFESFLEPIDKTHGKTKLYQPHVPSAFCLYVVSRVDGFSMDPITYVRSGNENIADIFCKELEETTRKIYDRFKVDAPMIFDEKARKLFQKQTECYACGKPFSDEDGLRKVRDHCHFTGKFRGALHSKCNLRLRKAKAIPVFFHNLEG